MLPTSSSSNNAGPAKVRRDLSEVGKLVLARRIQSESVIGSTDLFGE